MKITRYAQVNVGETPVKKAVSQGTTFYWIGDQQVGEKEVVELWQLLKELVESPVHDEPLEMTAQGLAALTTSMPTLGEELARLSMVKALKSGSSIKLASTLLDSDKVREKART